jgi:hypothetical protein
MVAALVTAGLFIAVVATWLVVRRFGGYDGAVASGRTSIPQVREFESLFKDPRHGIMYYTGVYGTPTWESKAGVFGRYIVVMQLPVRVSALGADVTPAGEPDFHMVEVAQITEKQGGQTEITYTGNQRRFDKQLWKRVVESRDLSLIGIDETRQGEVPGFAGHWMGG